jgi:hypothetical protein
LRAVNTHPYSKVLRIPDGTVDFFIWKPDGEARRLVSVRIARPAVSVPGYSTAFEVPQWDPAIITEEQLQKIMQEKRVGKLQVLVSINCSVSSNSGEESAMRFEFMPSFSTDNT